MRITLTLALILFASYAHAEKRHAGAHVHGINHVQIILDGTTLLMVYEFPIVQLREHDEHKHDEHKHDEHKHDEHKHDEHESDRDHAHLTEDLKKIASIFEFVRLPDSAECVQKKIDRSLRDVVADGGTSGDSGHKDVVIEAGLTCGYPDKITAFNFGPAFERFDDLAMIQVEGVVEDRSLSDSLTRERVLTSI